MAASTTYRILYSFGSKKGDGVWPGPGLINVNGILYGVANSGGSYGLAAGGSGTVFGISPTGNEKVVYSFGASGSYDASNPSPASRLLDVNGTLFGTTLYGGKTTNPPPWATGPFTASVRPAPKKSCIASTAVVTERSFPRVG